MSLLRALVASFHSPALYRSVAADWGIGRAIGLLALALALGWIVQVVAIDRWMQAWAEGEAARFIEQLPPLALVGGRLEATPPGPHVIPLEDDVAGRRLLVIDTSGGTVALADDVGVLVTATHVAARRNEYETRSFEVAQMSALLGAGEGPIAPASLHAGAAALARWVPLGLLPLAVAGELAYRLLAAAALACVGIALGALLRVRLPFARLYALALAALVPLVLVESVLFVLERPLPARAAAGIAVGVLALALLAVRAGSRPGPDPAPIG